MSEQKTKVRALKRSGVFIPEPTILHLTINEMYEKLGDPYDGQQARYGHGKAQVDKLWTPEALAQEIHMSPQATMLNKFNVEVYEDAAGKLHRAAGNRSQLAARILLNRHGVEPVDVVVETETPEGRALKLKHEKCYGVKFPVKFYGKLSPDQASELENRDNRAFKKTSEADFYFKGWTILKTTSISAQPSKEKMLVRRIGVGDVNDTFPTRIGLKKDGTPYLPCVTTDEVTGDITINGRENIQTFFRLFALPDAVVVAFIAGLAGEGPKIPKRALVALEEAWKEDKGKSKGRLNNALSLEEIEKLMPASTMLAKFKVATAKGTRDKKITAWTGGEMKKYEEGMFASSTLLGVLSQVQRRVIPSEKVLTAVIEAVIAGEQALGAQHPKIQAVFAAIEASQKNPESEAPEADDEENVDPETGEPLDSDE